MICIKIFLINKIFFKFTNHRNFVKKMRDFKVKIKKKIQIARTFFFIKKLNLYLLAYECLFSVNISI